MDSNTLNLLAYQKLLIVSPEGWDTDAFALYKENASKTDATEEEIMLGWKDGLAMAKETMPKMWEAYQRTLGKKVNYPRIPWDKVVFKKGAEDGNSYRLEFDIDGREIIIECSDIEIFSSDFISRKMILYSRKMVDCPYLTKSGKQNWLPGVVLPWLDHMDMAHAERENKSDQIIDLIRDFASKPIWKETFDKAFNQSREPVREGDTVYMPFSGLKAFVRKSLGADAGERYLTTVLLRTGAMKVKKGKNGNVFYSLNYDQLEGIAPSGAGIGEDNTDPKGSEGGFDKQWKGLADGVREEERTRHETKDRLASGSAEGETMDNDNSRGGVPLSESETGDEPDGIPF